MPVDDDLRAEYLLLRSQYETFDQRALAFKALATSLLSAGLGLGAKEHSLVVVAVTILISPVLNWKVFQYCRLCQAKAIADDEPDP